MSLDFCLNFSVDLGGPGLYTDSVFSANITHNVSPMWRKACVFSALYESEGRAAGELVSTLEAGVTDMQKEPDGYRALNPSNGWGDYDGALEFLQDVLEACKKYPKAIVWISR